MLCVKIISNHCVLFASSSNGKVFFLKIVWSFCQVLKQDCMLRIIVVLRYNDPSTMSPCFAWKIVSSAISVDPVFTNVFNSKILKTAKLSIFLTYTDWLATLRFSAMRHMSRCIDSYNARTNQKCYLQCFPRKPQNIFFSSTFLGKVE